MMETLASAISDVGPRMANHLWQSSLFAVGAAFTTALLKSNQARVRYGVWLAASIKFLLPFSFLIALGQSLGTSRPVWPKTALYSAVEVISQPFDKPVTQVAVTRTLAQKILRAIPSILLTVWAVGFVAATCLWWIRWRRVSSVRYAAIPMPDGREMRSLRRLETIAGIRQPIRFLLSENPLEPGIFGVFRPALLWPKGISKELQPAHVDAILAHEVWHVRRRDNLTAAVHMIVEAIFWFNPLIWWIGAHLIEERERACDEGVLQLGGEPGIYAESILQTCKFCVGSPLPCVSGVNGSNLKKRIVRIMIQQTTDKLSLGRKVLLASLGVAPIIAPIYLGVVRSPRANAQGFASPNNLGSALRIVSLKANHSGSQQIFFKTGPSSFTVTNATVKSMIENAYHVKDFQLSGGPSWIDSQRYDIEFEVPPHPVDATSQQKLILDRTLQGFLTDQLHLTLTRGTKIMSVYTLMVAGSGPKFIEQPTESSEIKEPMISTKVMVSGGTGQLAMTGPITGLVDAISAQLNSEVIDRTNLRGSYDLMLHWSTNESVADSLQAALQEQLGLKLTIQQHAVQTLAVDQIEMPTER